MEMGLGIHGITPLRGHHSNSFEMGFYICRSCTLGDTRVVDYEGSVLNRGIGNEIVWRDLVAGYLERREGGKVESGHSERAQ
jgi:hypothetical protein